MTKEYTNGETTVVWQPDKCIHSGVCLMGLPKVFSLKRKPWIQPENAATEDLEQLVFQCPSKALTIKGKEDQQHEGPGQGKSEVRLANGGPAIVYGHVVETNAKGKVKAEHTTVSLCRCTQSKNFPYCDGTHAQLKQNKDK